MRKDYVLGFAFNANKSKIVLVHKNRPKDQVGKLNGMGDGIENGETPQQAMKRECIEECGVETKESDWHYLDTLNKPFGDIVCYCAFDDAFMNARTTTDEKILILDTDHFQHADTHLVEDIVPLIESVLSNKVAPQ